MERYYGIIKDTESAVQFINDLYEATINDSGNSAVTMLSDYSLLSVSSMNSIFNKLSRQGIATTTITDESKQVILDVLTRNAVNNATDDSINVTSLDTVACIGDGLFIVVRPQVPAGETGRYLALMTVVHVYAYQDGEETVTGSTITELRYPNDNLVASAIAYEITPTKSGDALIKIASCIPDGPSSEDVLGPIFTSLKIHSYAMTAPGTQVYPPDAINCVRNHSSSYFGAAGNQGGFVLHAMHSDNSKYGLTIFNVDGTPLFTFVAGGKPFNILTEDETKFKYAISPLGRNISEIRVDDEDPESDLIIKMGVLAPIFCPSYDDRAEWAKWMQQGPHDYSYFDRSGHIRLKSNESSSSSVFFMDYGVALWDGSVSDYKLSDKAVPDIDPRNLSTYDRPDIEYPMPYGASDFFAYFDSKSGLSDSGWMNVYDDTNDMIFGGSPLINGDGSCRFTVGASGFSYGYFNGVYAHNMTTAITVIFAVLKLSGLDTLQANYAFNVVSHAENPMNPWSTNTMTLAAFKRSMSGNVDYPLTGLVTCDVSDSAYQDNNVLTVDPNDNYIVLYWSPTWNGSRISARAIKDGQYVRPNGRLSRLANNPVDNIWTIGGIYDGSSSISDTSLWHYLWSYQGSDLWVPPSDSRYGSSPSGSLNIDLAFLAIGTATPSNSVPCLGKSGIDYDTQITANMEYLAKRFSTVPQYSSANTYPASYYVMHEDGLFISNQAIETPEDWTPAHWSERAINQ